MNGVIRRRGLYSGEKDFVVITRPSYEDLNTIKTKLCDWMYSKGYSKSAQQITRKEAAKATGYIGIADGYRNVDMSYLQWLTSATSIRYYGIDYINNNLIILPPSIKTLGEQNTYRLNGLNVRIVLTGLTPPSSINNSYCLYHGTATIYFPDVAWDDYISAFSAFLSANSSWEAKKISQLSDTDKAKIQVVDINTLIGNK